VAGPSKRRSRLGWGLLGLLLVAVSIAAASQHSSVRDWAHAKVADAIRRELGLEAYIGSVRVSLPFGITGDYLSLTHPQHGLFASADAIEIQPSLWALLRGQIDIERILIEGARVRLRVVDGRIVNLPTFADDLTERKGKVERIPLEELVIQKARLTVDGGDALRGALHGMNAVLRVVDGTRLRLQLSVGAGELHHALGDEQVHSALLVAGISPGHVQVDQLRIDTSMLKLAVADAELGLPFEHGRYKGKLKLETDLNRVARLPLGVELPAVSGRIAIDMEIEGTGERYHARGKFHGDNPVLADFGLSILDLNLDITPDEIQVLPGSQGQVPDGGGLVMLQGRMGLTGKMPVQLKGDVKSLELHKLMSMLKVTDNCLVDWDLRGGFNISGTVQPVDISGPIWAEHLAFKALTSAWHDPAAREVIGTPPGRVNGRVAIRPDALRFENLHGRLPHSDVQVTVHIGFTDKISVTASSDNLDLRDATGLMGMPMTGVGSFTLDVGGTYSNTTLVGTLDMADFSLDGYRVGRLRSNAQLEKEGLAVRFVDSRVDKGESRYFVDDMLLDFSQAFSIDATARIDRLALADFYHTFAIENDPDFTPYQGHVQGTASVRYTLGFPDDDADGTLRVDTSLAIVDMSAYGQKFGAGSAEGAWIWKHIGQGTRGARLELAELTLHKDRGRVHARGTMDYGGQLNLTVFGEALMVKNFEAVRQSGLDVNGELNFVGKARGTPWVPEVALDVDLVGTSLGARAIDDAHFVFRTSHRDDPWVVAAQGLQPDAAEPCVRARKALAQADWQSDDDPNDAYPVPPRAVLMCGKGFGQRLAFDVLLGVAPELPARGQVSFARIPMAWVVPRPAGGAPVRGALSGQVQLTGGNVLRPDSLIGAVDVSEVTFGQETTWLKSDGPVRLALTGSGARIERARFVGHGSAVDVSGTASFATGLATHVAGRFDLALLSSLSSEVVRSTGSLALDVNVTGQPLDPSIYGRARLTDGSLLLRAYDKPLEGVSASVSFSEREVLLEEFKAAVLGGGVRLHGRATLRGQQLEHYELFINAKDLDYSPASGVELAFSGEAKLAYVKDQRIPSLTGALRLTRARYARPFSLGITERISFNQARRVERDTYDPSKDTLAIDLRVTDETPIRVSNNLLNAELSIEDSERPFRIVGTDQRMGVLGTLELTRGTLSFRNSEFVIEEGTVDFVDEHRIRPRLDVHARTEFRRTADASGSRWWISLHAFGEADDLKIETASEPALAQEDIALLLTVGLTRAEAERLGTTELTQGAALEALATVTGVDREVKKALPVIDDFAVTSAYSTRTNRTEPQVVVGKRLSDKVRATATTGVTADANFKTGVEWRLDDQTSIEAGYDNVQTTTSSQFGNVGVDLRWRLEFD
jgi:translocation and assembly module TamB